MPDSQTSPRSTGALEGVKVLDFSQMMLGPWATQFLGDLGADVLKIERPVSGDWERGLASMGELLAGESPFFLAMNRNKRSLALDLKHPEARRIVLALARDADVVVENYRPGVMDRLGLGYEALSAVNPRIIYASGSGYGPHGPYLKRPGQDLLIQALSGLAAHTGPSTLPPTPVGSAVVDGSTALMLTIGILAALHHQRRTGEGQKVDVSLFGTAVALQCQELFSYMNLGQRWERSATGVSQPWLPAPYGIFATRDGSIAIAMTPIEKIADVLELPELLDFADPAVAYERRDEVNRIIAARLRERSTGEWLDCLLAADVWCGPVNTFGELVQDPQLEALGLIQEVEHPRAGAVKVVAAPIHLSRTPAAIRRPPPLVGEHSAEALAEAGYEAAEIERLRGEGAI